MNYYFAPLEGLTGYEYRNIHSKFFAPADRYFSPFLSPNQNKKFSSREKNDVLPEHNENINLVPQLLTNNAQHFLWAANELKEMGYDEINLNLGCPSQTVVSKRKGAGFLGELFALREFLDEIFMHCTTKISIKTRLGIIDEDEFDEILQIFSRYPISELTIHPRVQKDFYKNPVRKEAFNRYFSNISIPLCYNGDLFTVNDCNKTENNYKTLNSLMLGRGALANPAIFGQLKGENGLNIYVLSEFHDELYASYKHRLSGDIPVLHKMKELWFYMHVALENGETMYKKLKKAKNLKDYEQIICPALKKRCNCTAPCLQITTKYVTSGKFIY